MTRRAVPQTGETGGGCCRSTRRHPPAVPNPDSRPPDAVTWPDTGSIPNRYPTPVGSISRSGGQSVTKGAVLDPKPHGARRPERVGENLNRPLATALGRDQRVTLMGQDVLDPYGGAFKISRGLSSRYPGSVLGTPISESGMLGMAAGLALCGERPIVEVMFGDFLALGFDPIVNFATKSVEMYGDRLPMHLVVRCPVGGNRGYGPTHSQSLQKHFVGVPGLSLYEMSPFHDNGPLLRDIL